VTSAVSAPARIPVWRHPEFARGSREMLGTSIGIAAWALITGVAMGKSGLPLSLMVLMSLFVFAGSAQLAVLPLMSSGAPLWVVWATALCVNLRFVIFSAQWRPYFVHFPLLKRLQLAYFTADLNYVMFMRRFPEPRPAPEQLPYFWGGVVTNWLAWQVPAMAGIFLADAVPVHWGIGFAGTLALLGLALSLLGGLATGVAGLVAGCAAVAAYALPFKLNIVVAIAAAVAIGLLIDHHAPPTPAVAVDDRT
jgi:predicted branched-subunit amino acid permease